MQERVDTRAHSELAIADAIQTPEGSLKLPLPFQLSAHNKQFSCSAELAWSPTHCNICIVTTGDKKPEYVSDFRLSAEKAPAGSRFKIVHREVLKGWKMAEGQATIAEETMDILHAVVRKLHLQFMYPGTIYINSSRPSLIQFFRKQGYTAESPEALNLFDEYMQEYKARPREDFMHIEPGVGSRFLLVHESARKDAVLVDKQHPLYDSSLFSVNERLVWLSRLPTMKPFVRMPYVVRCGFTKEIEL